MGETTKQIEHAIEYQRETLGANLHELEARVTAATDWRQHFQNHPMTAIGAAFGGGVLLAAVVSGAKGDRSNTTFTSRAFGSDDAPYAVSEHKRKALETLDHIKGALVALATTRVEAFLGDMIPGFQAQLNRTKQESTSSTGGARASQFRNGMDEARGGNADRVGNGRNENALAREKEQRGNRGPEAVSGFGEGA